MFSTDAKSSKPTKLTDAEIEVAMKTIPGWALNAEKTMISQKYNFKVYNKILSLVAAVGKIADEEKHHPEIQFGYGYCNIQFTTHDVKGLSALDFGCAAKINSLPMLAPKADASTPAIIATKQK